MRSIRLLPVIALSVALAGTAFAGPHGGGGGGRGGGGGHGGGGAHFGGGGHGGGGAHFGGGGAHFAGPRGGGGGHFAGARGFRGGGAHFAGGGRHFSGRAVSGGGGRAAVSRAPGGRAASFSRAAGGNSFRANSANLGHNAGGNLNRQGLNHQGFNRQSAMRANAVHHALAAGAVAGALHNHNALRNPDARAHISASAATAGWRGQGRNGGWWRHSHGGYGWVGPLFWPFAYYDLYGYTLWGYDPSLWDYGYGDIYAGIFAPYGYDDLAGYLPYGRAGYSSSGGTSYANAPSEVAQMCGDDSQEIAGLPIDRIQQALNPNDEQRKALDDLANASVRAAQAIKAACPNDVVSTAPARLAAMQTRLEAMISAVRIVQPPLDHFYGLLNDEQKARLTSLGEDQRRGRNDQGALAQNCGTGQATDWPAAEIERRVRPTDAQRASFDNLKEASAKAADILKGTCQPNEALTPPARLSAAGKRLDAMLQAVETVKSALDSLYSELSDEQKAQFESIGPSRDVTSMSSSDGDNNPASRRTYRRHHTNVVGLVRRLIGF